MGDMSLPFEAYLINQGYVLIFDIMRKLFFGGNWKCNNTLAQTQGLVSSLLDKLEFDPQQAGNIECI
jgi:hypothetical protein